MPRSFSFFRKAESVSIDYARVGKRPHGFEESGAIEGCCSVCDCTLCMPFVCVDVVSELPLMLAQ